MDVVYAIETSNAVDDNLLRYIKQYAAASLDYFTFNSVASHVGIASYGSTTKTPLTLSSGVSPQVARYSLNTLPRVGGKADLLRMLNTVEERIFKTHGRDNIKKLLLIFMKSDNLNQFSDAVKTKLSDMRSRGIQPSFILINEKELDFTNTLYPVIGNFFVDIKNGNLLPTIYPDFERLVANLVGKCLNSFSMFLSVFLHQNSFKFLVRHYSTDTMISRKSK